MRYAFIKDNTCVNIGIFDNVNIVSEFEVIMIHNGAVDEILLLPDGFRIGDKYENDVWIKTEQLSQEQKQLTVEDYLIDLDFRVSLIELGLEV